MFKTEKIKAKYLYLTKYITRNENAYLLPYVSYTKRCASCKKNDKSIYHIDIVVNLPKLLWTIEL